MGASYIDIHHDLIEACRSGSREAQFKIYKLYYKAMYNTSLRIVNDTAEAEDIMQESFLNAFQKLSTYQANASFGSWLKRIVVNQSLDALRKKQEQLPMDEVFDEISEVMEEDREEEIQCRVKEVRTAIDQLPDEYRVVLSLFLLEGYDHEEISEILHISNQLSRTRYFRARQKLLEILKEREMKNSYLYN